MHGTLAQWTGVVVTVIVVTGTDMDMLYAVPLGIFAGALASFFAATANARLGLETPARAKPRREAR